MLVDKSGDVVITNDGVSILTMMEVNHPAARMMINIARAQEEEIGDGTTTATIMAGTLVAEGVNQAVKGVPVARVIDGIRLGVRKALEALDRHSRPVRGVDESVLRQAALIAGRGHEDIAGLVMEAAGLVGEAKLREQAFKFARTVTAREGAANEVFMGVIIEKERMNRQMPQRIEDAKLLVIDDALEPEEFEEEALATDAGFARYLALQEEFKEGLQKLTRLGVNVVLVDRGVADIAEEMLADAGIMVLQRVASRDIRRVAEHTGARLLKRTALRRNAADLARYIGQARAVYEDEHLEQVRVVGGAGSPMATILVGAATAEVVQERERIAQDAAAAVQAAIRGGVVPGGGAVEIALMREVQEVRGEAAGMAAFGVDCLVEALKRPLAQIVANAGFNPLEKVSECISAQAQAGSDSLGVDCDTGEIVDMLSAGVVDPTLVKAHALRAAGEIAEAILRIDTIIKMREAGAEAGPAARDMDSNKW